ncbi:MAG: hypothetical protein AAF989_09155, partial [Planctomycetota bacterium]
MRDRVRRRKRLQIQLLESRLPLAGELDLHGPAGVDVPLGLYTHEEIHELEAFSPSSELGSPTFTALQDVGDDADVLTFILDFKEASQGSTFDIFGNEITSFDVTDYGFAANEFDLVAESVLAEVNEDFFTELIGTVAGPVGAELAVDFLIGDIGWVPAGVSEYYYIQIGTGVAGPHSGGSLGVANVNGVRNASGAGPNGRSVGDVVGSVFTDTINTLGGLTPSDALTSGNILRTTRAISGTLSHEIAHTLSLTHINFAGSVQPTPSAPPIMGTGAIDLPNLQRIFDREFSLSGVDGQNGNAPRQHVQQLVNALGLRDIPGVSVASSGDETLVSENGLQDDYEIGLQIEPAGPVTIDLNAGDELLISVDEGTTFVSTTSLTLADTTPVSVQVRAVDDSDSEAIHSGVVTHQISATSDVANYPLDLPIDDVLVTIVDNEPVEVSFDQQIGVAGALAYSSEESSRVPADGELVTFRMELDPGQKLSVELTPDGGLQGNVTLRDSASAVATVAAGAAGDTIFLDSAEIATGGEYFLDISGLGGTVGEFDLELFLNTGVEQEGRIAGSSNDVIADAEDIDPTRIPIDSGGSRLAVIGTGNGGLSEGFESGFLDDRWETTSSGLPGRIRVLDTQTAANGQFALFMDREGNGESILNEAVWTVNLSGVSSATLNFAHADFSDEETSLPASFTNSADGDGVSISEDGVTWHTILNATSLSAGIWENVSVDLVAVAAGFGISLGEDFKIKFQQFDNFDFPSDGRGYDSIEVVTIPSRADDWYRFTAADGDSFSVVLASEDSDSDDVIELYDSAGVLRALSIGEGNQTEVIRGFLDSTTDGVDDEYFVRVVSPLSAYTLVVTQGVGFNGGVNQTLDQAQDLGSFNSVLGHVGESTGPALSLLDEFAGPNSTGFIPPDPTVGVGPEQIVAAVNTDIAIYDKASGNQLFLQNMNGAGGFFGSVGATSTVFDPWVIFDDDSERFFVIGIDIANDTESNVFIAVSQDSTPTSGSDWHKYKLDFTHDPAAAGLGTGAHFPDYEKLGVNDDAIFVSGNYFAIDQGSGVYAGITAIEKGPLLTGGAANILYEEHFSGFSVFPLNQFDSGGTQYFAEELGGSSIRIHAITDVLNTPVRSTFDLAVPAYQAPVNVPQLGGGAPADSVGPRIMTGVWRDGSAWFAHGIIDPTSGDGENVARWYEVSTNQFPTNNPTLVQSGNVDPGPDVHAWMPAIAVDGSNNMAIGFSTGGPNQFFGAGFAGRLNDDPLGFTSEVREYATGLANYEGVDSVGRNRWGDYSGLAIDPSDDATFWVFNEFASTGNRWATQIASFQLDPIVQSDFYSFSANVGDPFSLQTRVPFDGPGDVNDLLDPAIELYDPDGVLLGTSDNDAVDGR